MPEKAPAPPPPLPPVKPPITELRGALFHVAVPEGWTDRSLYAAAAPVTVEGLQPNVTVTQENQPEMKDLEAYSKNLISDLSGQLPGFKLLKSEKCSIGGRDARVHRYTWKNPRGVVLRQSQWHVYKAPTAFIVTATAPDGAYDRFGEQFEELVKGMTFAGK